MLDKYAYEKIVKFFLEMLSVSFANVSCVIKLHIQWFSYWIQYVILDKTIKN